jgi:hypothetical protein
LEEVKRRVVCLPCGTINLEVAPERLICAGCGRLLAVRAHFSRRLEAFMGVAATPATTAAGPGVFRGGFSFRNTPATIARFPFPFPGDRFAYAVNLRPHVPDGGLQVFDAMFDTDAHYEDEMADRALTLAADPRRCQALSHMAAASWEALALLLEQLAKDYPRHFVLARNGDSWRWENRVLGQVAAFTFGDEASLGSPPLAFIGRQVQGDFILLDQRADNLFLDGGVLTAPADWSLHFNLGMSFTEFHAPVARQAHEAGVFDRSLRFLLRLKPAQQMRRLNWSLAVDPRLDTAPESWGEWGWARETLTPETIGHRLCLRVELQTLTRLMPSGAILFGIRTYLLRFEELATVPEWARRLHGVLAGLHPEIAAYKGMAFYREMAVAYLAACAGAGAEISS